MNEQQIKDSNRLIAEFMGYTFYHKGVDIDDSDIGGLYTRKEVFSMIPIEVDEYPNEDQFYFKKVHNPDYKIPNSKRFRNDWETLCWSTVNYSQYKTDLDYHSNWNSLIHVVEKIEGMDYGFKMCRKVVEIYVDSTKEVLFKTKESCRLDSLYKAVVYFIKLCYNK